MSEEDFLKRWSRRKREVAKAETLWAMVATEGGRPRRIPPEVRALFARKGAA